MRSTSCSSVQPRRSSTSSTRSASSRSGWPRVRLPQRPRTRPQPASGPAPAPAPAPQPVPVAVPVPDSDVIQRTLILAQKAADEAVADAQAKSAQLMSESEAKARRLVSEAESTARRIAESERRRIEAEIAQLGTTRDALAEMLMRSSGSRPTTATGSARRSSPSCCTSRRREAMPSRPRPAPAADRGHVTFASTAARSRHGGAGTDRRSGVASGFAVDPEPTMAVEAVTAASTRGCRPRRGRAPKSPSAAEWTSRRPGTRRAAPRP